MPYARKGRRGDECEFCALDRAKPFWGEVAVVEHERDAVRVSPERFQAARHALWNGLEHLRVLAVARVSLVHQWHAGATRAQDPVSNKAVAVQARLGVPEPEDRGPAPAGLAPPSLRERVEVCRVVEHPAQVEV